MDFLSFFTSLLSAENGILAFGWVIAAFLGYKLLLKKEAGSEDIKTLNTAHADDMRTVKTSYEKELSDLRAAHIAEVTELRKTYETRMMETEDELEARLKEASDRIHDMNESHIRLITDMSDKRIDDIKALNEDYNAMAESVRLTIEKLAQSLSKKR
jgi:hypothetical protein